MRSDDYRIAERRFEEASQLQNYYSREHESLRINRNKMQESNIQMNSTRSNLELRLEQVIVIIRVFDVNIPAVVLYANNSARNVDSSYHTAIVNKDFKYVSLEQAFRTRKVEEDPCTSSAQQDCHNEKSRIESEIARINAEINRLNATIGQMDSQLSSYRNNFNHYANEARHYQNIMNSIR